MTGATFYNMKLLCYIDDTDFTDYQGIGSDPMYRRFESVHSVVKKHIDSPYQGLLARPHYDDGVINWYVDEWQEYPICFTQLTGQDKDKYAKIKDDTLAHYKLKMQKISSEDFAILSGALKYVDDSFIYCYDNRIVLVVWGMRPDTTKHKGTGSWIKGLKIEEKHKVAFDCGINGKIKNPIGIVINRKKGHRIISKDIPEIIANDGYEFVSWNPEPIGFEVNSDVVFKAQYKNSTQTKPSEPTLAKITFEAGSHGDLSGENSFTYPIGHVLSLSEIPNITPHDGYIFSHWTPNVASPIKGDTMYTAEYEPQYCTFQFNAGEHGTIIGQNEITKKFGSNVANTDIPKIKPQKGYKFIGWNTSPTGLLNGNKTIIAQYQKEEPWYRSLWLWFTGKGCLKWLLWLLLIIMAIWLLSWLLKGCVINTDHTETNRLGNSIIDENSVAVIERIRDNTGVEYDNNGIIADITDSAGNLPEKSVVAPIINEKGEAPAIIHNDGVPDVVGNRLNIYFEHENADLNKWAKDFKQSYPQDDYLIIGYDPNVKMIQIQIPESQREKIRNEINKKIPDQEFFVVDESIITLQGNIGQTQNESNKGWHIKATNLQQAWNTTRGSPNVVVAIVDDGIDTTHSMFNGRIYKAYNVFTQNRTLSSGVGHGTHVAGLAVGSAEYLGNGVAGVAPNCKIMPIQVFDNDLCTFSSIASGIMYAIHNGADVVNISIGPSFKGLDTLPLTEQKKVAETLFKNEERVYQHIIKTANEKNVILVFAAGNDNILTEILPECRYAGHTINVAAVTPNYLAANFTNYSEGANISAPGVDIYSSYPVNSFKMLEGTSMAAPIVTGAVALMRSIKQNLTVEQAIYALQNSGKPIDKYVPNMLLIDRALEVVKKGNYNDSSDLDTENKQITPIADTESGVDDYSALKQTLEQLKAQRDSLNAQISNIENKIK